MYWLLTRERDDDYATIIYGIPSIIEKLNINMYLGDYIDIKVPVVDIKYERDPRITPCDTVVAAPALGLVINSKVKSVFDSQGIKNIQYFPARLVETSKNYVEDDWFLANIVGKFKCVNFEKSEVSQYENGNIQFIDKLVLKVDDSSNYGDIFRMAEFRSLIVISERLKNALESADLKGFKVYKPERYSI